MKDLLQKFAVKGKPVACVRYGCGHINETYLCTCDSGLSYILQRISQAVFPKPAELMENVSNVTSFLAAQGADPRSYLHLIPTLEQKSCYVDEQGEYWRVYDFVSSSCCLQKAESAQDFYNSGLAFGRFQRQLAQFPVEVLHEPIADFHNTRVRYDQFQAALERNFENRAATCQPEIDFVLSHAHEAGTLVDMLKSGELRTRVTHNDAKLNNVLLDYDTHEPLCIIDLDTVMPGSALYDYGDSIRFGASSAAEDEQDLSKVWLDLELFRTYTQGYLAGCGGSLSQAELDMMPMSAKLMTLECGVRFLSDYLNGDVYFHTQYPTHNLVRARTQFKLVQDDEAKWDAMRQIVEEAKA